MPSDRAWFVERRLAAFLRNVSSRPFRLGVFDCGLLIADWCIEMRGVDPAASIRGRYDSVDGARGLVGQRLLPKMIDVPLRTAGLERTRDPAYGDVAVIRLKGDNDLRGAIATAGWVVIGEAGLSRVGREHARCIRAWSITQWRATLRERLTDQDRRRLTA